MNPFELIPTPDPIPAPGMMFRVLLDIFFMIHILLVNMMVGTGVIALISGLKKRDALPLQKDVARKLPVIVALAVNMGVAPLLVIQLLYGQFIYVSSTLMAVFWILAVGLLILAYTNIYYHKMRFDILSTGFRRFFLGSAVLMLLIIGFTLSNNMTLMLNPASWPSYFDRPDGFLLNLKDRTLFPRYLHFMIASIAIGGLVIAIVWTFKKKTGRTEDGPSTVDQNIRLGMGWFTGATLAQILVGFWFQMSLPEEILNLFMGSSLLHTAVFIFGIGLVIQTVYYGITVNVRAAAVSVTLLIADMILIRDLVRTAYLNPYFTIRDLTVIQQTGPMLMFWVVLATVLTLIFYLLRRLTSAKKSAPPPKG
ncbi:MAG: hypothetical protein RBT16_03195 [Desulfococcus multivorans]|jgi:hypothetical protein|nr:hypothetical protein [Desulfococcus multivorans]